MALPIKIDVPSHLLLRKDRMAALQTRGWCRLTARVALLACALVLAGCNLKIGGDFVSVLDDEQQL
jgi:hypothetical protein